MKGDNQITTTTGAQSQELHRAHRTARHISRHRGMTSLRADNRIRTTKDLQAATGALHLICLLAHPEAAQKWIPTSLRTQAPPTVHHGPATINPVTHRDEASGDQGVSLRRGEKIEEMTAILETETGQGQIVEITKGGLIP